MDHLKSDFLKVLMLFIILFSLTSGCQQQKAFNDCKYGMDICFGLDKPLLVCVKRALVQYKSQVLEFIGDKYVPPYAQDVNQYYWSMHNLVSAEGIELKEEFCKRLDDETVKKTFFAVENPNVTDCESRLAPFEDTISGSKTHNANPNDSEEIRVSKLKKRILYNALYDHTTIGFDSDSPYIHIKGSYGYDYLYEIGDKLTFIKEKDITPEKFCELRYKKKDKDNKDDEDEGTSK